MASEKDLVINIRTEYKDMGLADLKAELKLVNARMDELKKNGQHQSTEFNNLKTRAGVLTSEIRGLSREFKGLDSNVKMSRFQLLELYENITVAIAGFYALAAGVINFTKSSIDAFARAELAVTRLRTGLENFGNQDYLGSLINQAEHLQSISIFADDDIMNAQSFLALQGRNGVEIEKTTLAATRLALVTGEDLNSAVRKLDQTYEGNLGRLTKLDSRFRELSQTQLENGEAIDLVNEKYAELEEKIGNTTYGKIKKLENAWDDLKESFGEGFVNGVQNQLSIIQPLMNDTTSSTYGLKIAFEALGFAASSLFGFLIPIVTALADIGNTIGNIQHANKIIANRHYWKFGLVSPDGTDFSKPNMMGDLREKESHTDTRVPTWGKSLDDWGKQKQNAEDKLKNLRLETKITKENTEAIKKYTKERDEANTKIKEYNSLLGFDEKKSKGGSSKTKAEKDALNELIELVKTEIKLEELSGALRKNSALDLKNISIEILNTKMSELEAGESLIKNEKDRLKLLEAQLEIKKQIAELTAFGAYSPLPNNEPATDPHKLHEAKENRIIEGKSEPQTPSKEPKVDWKQAQTEVSNIVNLLNLGGHTFISQLINGLNTAVGLVTSIVSLLNNISQGGGLFSFLGGLLSFLPGGSALGAAASFIGGRRADGGNVNAGSLYLTGEKGMELFIPRQNGYIMNNKDLASLVKNTRNSYKSNISIYLNAKANSGFIFEQGRREEARYKLLTRV